MLPFQIAEAIRRALRRRDEPVRRATGLPMWRLLAGEVAHLGRACTTSPAGVVGLLGVVSALGVHVALGPAYPGPVAPDVARWLLVVLVLAASVGLARTVPSRWRDARRAVGRVRVGLVVALSASVLSIVKVGLHEVTPGPVLPATARWLVVASVVVIAVVLLLGRDHTSDS